MKKIKQSDPRRIATGIADQKLFFKAACRAELLSLSGENNSACSQSSYTYNSSYALNAGINIVCTGVVTTACIIATTCVIAGGRSGSGCTAAYSSLTVAIKCQQNIAGCVHNIKALNNKTCHVATPLSKADLQAAEICNITGTDSIIKRVGSNLIGEVTNLFSHYRQQLQIQDRDRLHPTTPG